LTYVHHAELHSRFILVPIFTNYNLTVYRNSHFKPHRTTTHIGAGIAL